MTTYTERTSTESPVAARRVRTSIGLLTLTRHRRAASLVLSVAAGRARGTHSDDLAGQDEDEAAREQRETCADLMREHDLVQITVYAPASHGGHTVDVCEAE